MKGMLQSLQLWIFPLDLLSSLPQLLPHILQFIFESDSDLLDLSVYVALSLGFEMLTHILQLLAFWPFQTSASHSPLVYLSLQLLTSSPLQCILFLKAHVYLAVFDLVLLELLVELLTKNLHLVRFLHHSLFLQFVHVASLAQLPNLHLITLIVVSLPLPIFLFHSQQLNLSRQPFNFDTLEDDNKVELGRKILLSVPWQIRYPWSECSYVYLRSSLFYGSEICVLMKDGRLVKIDEYVRELSSWTMLFSII